MADAPSSGGSDWGVFEIALGVLLLIALLSNIGNKGKPYKPLEITEEKTTEIAPIDDSANRCGLSIKTPLSFEKVSTAVHVSGLVSGCNWEPDGQTALFAQVINGGGVPISDFVAIQNNNTDVINVSFDTAVVLNSTAKSGTAYLLLMPAKKVVDKNITVRIPIKIVRN